MCELSGNKRRPGFTLAADQSVEHCWVYVQESIAVFELGVIVGGLLNLAQGCGSSGWRRVCFQGVAVVRWCACSVLRWAAAMCKDTRCVPGTTGSCMLCAALRCRHVQDTRCVPGKTHHEGVTTLFVRFALTILVCTRYACCACFMALLLHWASLLGLG